MLTGVDLLSLDGLRAVRCLDSVAFPEVRRFLRVAKWVYKAGQMLLRLPVAHAFYLNGFTSSPCGCQAADCTLVTTSSRLPKKVKDWLEMSRDQHRPIRKNNLRRCGVHSTRPSDCLPTLFHLFNYWCRITQGSPPRCYLPGWARARHCRENLMMMIISP